jgi:hypothetical protein
MHDTPTVILAIHSLIRSFLLVLSTLLLIIIITVSRYEYLAVLQRIINIIALLVIIIAITSGTGYFADYIFWGSETAKSFLPLCPFYGLITLLVHTIVIILIQSSNTSRNKIEIPYEDIENDESITKNIEELLERIVVKSGHKIHVIQVDDIYFLQADGDYVQIHTKDGKCLKEQTLKFFHERLSPKKFVRIHRSTIVNIEHISRIELFEKQSQQLILKNGEHLKMSISGYKSLNQALDL